jgi:hypothetical protein
MTQVRTSSCLLWKLLRRRNDTPYIHSRIIHIHNHKQSPIICIKQTHLPCNSDNDKNYSVFTSNPSRRERSIVVTAKTFIAQNHSRWVPFYTCRTIMAIRVYLARELFRTDSTAQPSLRVTLISMVMLFMTPEFLWNLSKLPCQSVEQLIRSSSNETKIMRNRMRNEWWMGRDLEGSDHNLFESIIEDVSKTALQLWKSIQIYRGHTQHFELSLCSKTLQVWCT